VKPVGEPDAVAQHVRFDERGWETGRWPLAPSYRAHPRLYLLLRAGRPRFTSENGITLTVGKSLLPRTKLTRNGLVDQHYVRFCEELNGSSRGTDNML
jgi:hypothetical protein